ncbi:MULTISPECIES: ligand-binding sensor domain-containing protein [Thiorhodovibrio]|uniref:ABC transporter substrate-binding protein n=1 Tax=Thiorhodovibrio TaxID=61593 RepID=UPI0019118758|nr:MULTISPECIES: ABC transporter substrate-binding protein [Thiorhodovibrio]MBK5969727.1 hypothetical protein [Thiorhodovibrio winogradskyi]WPL13776.1 hypothetical protein Thiosp_03593 [Thiorhodovibrio litoralis]
MPPKQQKTAAITVAAIGLVVTVAGPLMPGGERLERNSPPYTGHVTDLAGGSVNPADDQSLPLLAGTSAGEIWSYQAGLWQHLPLDFGGHPITTILGHPSDNPVGTAGGVYNPPPGISFTGRVGDLMQTPAGLLAGNELGIHLLSADGNRVMNQGMNVYRFISQTINGETYLHAGTVGAGVHSTKPENIASDWPANNAGLPADAYVYSFAVTEGGKLIAGTKSGLFWQSRPGETWQPLDAEHGDTRVLSLYLAPSSSKRSQHLWIGTDGHLLHADLVETDTDLHVPATAVAVKQPMGTLPFGISWIRPTPDGVMISAGAVYHWGPARLPGWYWISIGGIVLLLIAGWMLPGREESSEGEPESTA